MVELHSPVTNSVGYTWHELYALFCTLERNISAECAYSLVFKTFKRNMEAMQNNEIYYYPYQAFALLAARARRYALELPAHGQLHAFSARECYRFISNVLSLPANGSLQVFHVMNAIDFLVNHDDSLPEPIRAVFSSIIQEYREKKFKDLNHLREELLDAIAKIESSTLPVSSKNHTVQACCHILSLFH